MYRTFFLILNRAQIKSTLLREVGLSHWCVMKLNYPQADFPMQHTYRTSKTALILSYLPRFIKIVRADFERSANMPKHPLINYPPLDRLLLMTPKNRISVLVLFHIHSFILIPLVLSSPATVTENTRHVLKFSDLRDQGSSKSQHRFFFSRTVLSLSGKKKVGLSEKCRPKTHHGHCYPPF